MREQSFPAAWICHAVWRHFRHVSVILIMSYSWKFPDTAPVAFHRLEPRRLCKSDSGLISDLPRPTGMSHFSIWSTKRVACHWQLTREWRTVCSTCRPLAANTTASLTSVLKPRKQIAADQLAEFNSAYFVFEAISNIYRASRDFSATAEVIHCTH